MPPEGLIRPSILKNVTTAPSKHETKASLKKDLKIVYQYVLDLEREHKMAFGALEAELVVEKAKVQVLGRSSNSLLQRQLSQRSEINPTTLIQYCQASGKY